MDNLIECRALCKNYGSVQALRSIDLSIPRGRVVGLLGPNGSGKTTFIKLACGLLTPTSGEIEVCGFRPGPESKARVSFLPDRCCLDKNRKVKGLVAFYADFYSDFDSEKAMHMLSLLGISPESRLRALSKGQQEKVQLILCMSRRAELYLLDEPIGGVDPASRDYILSAIIGSIREDATLVISTHLISDVEKILDHVIFVNEGRIVLNEGADDARERTGLSLDQLFREEFKCTASL